MKSNYYLLLDSYEGEHLQIGIIGETIEDEFENVTFHNAKSEILKINDEKYDTLFITEVYFEELSKDDWTKTFLNISTRVFFINLNKQSFIFRVDDMDYNEKSSEAIEKYKRIC